jgi:hypothetical protein
MISPGGHTISTISLRDMYVFDFSTEVWASVPLGKNSTLAPPGRGCGVSSSSCTCAVGLSVCVSMSMSMSISISMSMYISC